MSSKKTYQSTSQARDPIPRGVKRTDILGTALFFGLRAADPFLQYQILANGLGSGLITALGGTVLPNGPPLVTNTLLDRYVGLSPYRTVLLAMSIGSMIKQNAHLTTIMQEPMLPLNAVIIGTLNDIFNSLNSLFFVIAQTSASLNGEHFPQTPLIVGSAMYATGIFLEWYSEAQRHAWKKDPANKGKVYDAGLFGLSRHINYFGYTLWRSGYALAGGGWIWGSMIGALFVWDFTGRSIPVLQHYLEERYGEKYADYMRAVPYKFIPFLW